jgi:mannose-1-phosphate guanylyltransferase
MCNKPLVLILCGGRSLRLWPLSQYKTKNFLNIFGFSPLELTIKRFLKITTKDRIYLVANQSEKKALKKIKLIKKGNIFFEPQSKNTAAAVLLSLQYLKKFSSQTLIISPVDHFIEKEKEFYKSLNKAQKAVQSGGICTLGIKPDKPTTDFGYIEVSPKSNRGIFPVKKFIEKPKISLAKKLIGQGKCFYNSGMFVAKIDTLINEYRKNYRCYDYFVKSFSRRKIPALYKRLESIPFDKAIMEKIKKAKLVKANFFWKDFGNWLSIYEILAKDKNKNAKKGKVSLYQAKDNLIYLDNPKKKVLALGLKDVFFIDTEGFTLLASRSQIDNLKKYLSQF